jgi:hypothetical protein
VTGAIRVIVLGVRWLPPFLLGFTLKLYCNPMLLN